MQEERPSLPSLPSLREVVEDVHSFSFQRMIISSIDEALLLKIRFYMKSGVLIEWFKHEESLNTAIFILVEIAQTNIPDISQPSVEILSKNFEVIKQNFEKFVDGSWHLGYIGASYLSAMSILAEKGGEEYKRKVKQTLLLHLSRLLSVYYGKDFWSVALKESICVLIDCVDDTKEKKEKDLVRFKILEHFKREPFNVKPPDNFMLISCLLSSNSPYKAGIGKEMLCKQIKSYGLPDRKTLRAWIESTKKEEVMISQMLVCNFGCIESVEKERPGIVEFLNQKFGIFDFGRYPAEMLIRQYDEYENTKIPYGVVLYSHSDHNGALYKYGSFLKNLFLQLDGKVAIRICEVKDKIEVMRLIFRLYRKYGGCHKISFVIVVGHGNKEGIMFSDLDDEKCFLCTQDLQDPRADIKFFFEENNTVILSSCSVGIKGGIGQEISRVLRTEVIAPNGNTYVERIDVVFRKNNHLKFRVQYGTKGVETRYKNGKKQ